MTDYEDYENNLAFPPEGDWTDTEPKNNTDRTASSIELINKIEELNKWLDLKSEYIEKLEQQIEEANKIILSFDRLVGELIGTVFKSVLDYYKKYNVSREKGERK